MQLTKDQWRTVWLVVGGGALCVALVWGGLLWRDAPPPSGTPTVTSLLEQAQQAKPLTQHPFLELLKLVSAAAIGMVVTAVHRRYRGEKPMGRSLEQAQVLLCVSGAMMMIIIGDSLSRALGIAGGAAIVRFRTPVEDPKDATMLFLLLGLGMSCGLGAFAVSGLAALFLCLFLVLLDRFGERQKPRAIMLQVVAEGPEFPSAHVDRVLGAAASFYEPREVSQGLQTSIRYHVILDPQTSLAYLSQQLMGDGAAGLKSVSWEAPKKGG